MIKERYAKLPSLKPLTCEDARERSRVLHESQGVYYLVKRVAGRLEGTSA
jgi:hypothetical protein